MSLLAASLFVAGAAVALPPPLCRGKVYARYDQTLDSDPGKRALAEVRTALNLLCGLDAEGKKAKEASEAQRERCGRGIVVYENDTIGMNAVTWVSGIRDGAFTKGRIVYSRQFLNALDQSFGAGASFGVLAHEVGHYMTAAMALRSHVDHAWDEELRADYLAGCALGRAGRPPDEMENTLRALASVASRSHPSFHLRVPKVRKGYDDCRAQQLRIDDADAEARFGIGALVRDKTRKLGCWSFFFRAADDVARVGPVAASRHRSRHFKKQIACEKTRQAMQDGKLGITEPCTCRR